MINTNILSPRWQNYIFDHGNELNAFWSSHLSSTERHVLFVLGKGFDPRMCTGIKMLLSAGGLGRRDIISINLEEGILSPSRNHIDLVDDNWKYLEEIVSLRCDISKISINIRSEDGRNIGSRNAANIFKKISDFENYTDVIIDISAMPRSIYFPLISKVLYLLDINKNPQTGKMLNLHIFVSESPFLDRHIRDEDVSDRASYIHPFSGGLEKEATAGVPKVWIPLLGEKQEVQLERIYDLVVPDEISPVLPSPSLDPRRGDNLIQEYQGLLFDRLTIEPRNFIYASERNPFEVYRQIRKAIFHYREALGPLGGCKVVLSALSTKLMSVGALLVAYELKQIAHEVQQPEFEIGVAHVESRGYVMDKEHRTSPRDIQSELFGLWLCGECYEP